MLWKIEYWKIIESMRAGHDVGTRNIFHMHCVGSSKNHRSKGMTDAWSAA